MQNTKQYKIMEIDPYLQSYEADIDLRMSTYEQIKAQLLQGHKNWSSFANGHLYYGFHRNLDGWIYREWAPNADSVSLIGDFNNWDSQTHKLNKLTNGNWEIFIPDPSSLTHGSLLKVRIWADGKTLDRIPLYIKRVVQDPATNIFCGQIWQPEQAFIWTDSDFQTKSAKPLLIYESHIGMSGENEGIATYLQFAENILPRVKEAGYNAVQLMAIMEHPYYGSFGYQVSNFFAASSRFGTPDELKYLINAAHSMGIVVLLDLIHSHAVCNTNEGINEFDGTDYQFFHKGERGNHPAWGTKLFNYGKPQVLHFLLSNLKFWLEEYHFDGFRFDGVTSMLYHNHGLGICFDNYKKYFDVNTDTEAITYLQCANELIKKVRPDAISICEDMSGMPGMCLPIRDGGIGFDYRLGMGVPDFWINTLRTLRDEDWNLGHMWHELTSRRPKEKTIGYSESHDQALVGDKTIMFWLADQEMYWHMNIVSNNYVIERAIALHKLIRLITCSLAGEGYLNFMGNEFGHPEWIDFPRQGNGWSYKYARRQWSLAQNNDLHYKHLLSFDNAMIGFVKSSGMMNGKTPKLITLDQEKKLIAFNKNGYLFAFNFHPTHHCSLEIPAQRNKSYRVILNTDWEAFGGRTKEEQVLPDEQQEKNYVIKLLIPKRVALILKAD